MIPTATLTGITTIMSMVIITLTDMDMIMATTTPPSIPMLNLMPIISERGRFPSVTAEPTAFISFAITRAKTLNFCHSPENGNLRKSASFTVQ
jgi:hypothetical protein